MRRHIIYATAVAFLVVLACAAVFWLYRGRAAPTAGHGGIFQAVDSTSTPVSITTSTIQQPPNTKEYQNATYRFSLYYPNDLTVNEQQVGAGSVILLFTDQMTQQGFQIFVTPYGEPKITQQRFQMDEQSGVMEDPQNITVSGAAATEFFSTNQAMGDSREIWFLNGGYLYEVTAPRSLDTWLLSIMQTWQFTQ